MKIWKITVIVLIAVCVPGIVLTCRMIRRGFSAREKPGALETLLAEMARELAVPVSKARLKNPLPDSAENVMAGMEHFADHCALCHANNGSGDTAPGRNMYPRPPDLRLEETQNKTDGELYYTIYNGIRLSGMPAFGKEDESDADSTWRLVLFIRHIPALTAEEEQRMKGLNPRSAHDLMEEKEEEEFLRK